MNLGPAAYTLLKDADVVLVIDCDLPWTPSLTKPPKDCRVFYLDIDPLKEDIPVWYIPAERFMRADSHTALKQLNARLDRSRRQPDYVLLAARREKYGKMRAAQQAALRDEEKLPPLMTAAYVSACVRSLMDEDTILLNETITSTGAVSAHIPRNKPGRSSAAAAAPWAGSAAPRSA
jgi:acetolactate synthase-1/2/3 large subunit